MNGPSFASFFYDPVLRAPTIACMLMCVGASLIGVVVFLRRQSLIGEALSHAAYPGVILGALLAGLLSLEEFQEGEIIALVLIGAFFSATLGAALIAMMQKRLKAPSDAALCFVLSSFFGIGVTLASDIQFVYPGLYKQALTYLYGQAATMTDLHIGIYGLLALVIAMTIFFLYKEVQLVAFDAEYGKTLGVSVKGVQLLLFFLLVLAVVIGIRSVGVVLMSAMLIAPAAAARLLTHKLSSMLVWAAVLGSCSAFLGIYLSVNMGTLLENYFPKSHLSIPTGPAIVLAAFSIFLFALLFAPEQGLVPRGLRIARFRYECLRENLLKAIWKFGAETCVSLEQIAKYHLGTALYLRFVLWTLQREGWLINCGPVGYRLTREGSARAAKIVRLHRLWELYLVHDLGIGVERVHKNAEEMEHILTPEIENALTKLLNDPQQDPHHQPIPSRENHE